MRRAHDAKPNSVATHAMKTRQPHASALADTTAWKTASPPSVRYDTAMSGNGGTRLDQTTSANMSASCSPAAYFATMLPAAHANADTIISTSPMNVELAPLASLNAARSTMP